MRAINRLVFINLFIYEAVFQQYVCMYVHVRKILKMFTKLETEAFTSQQQVRALKHLL